MAPAKRLDCSSGSGGRGGSGVTPASFEQKFVVIQAKLGDSVRLDCNATGDQPLQIDWFREGTNSSLEKHGNDLYDIHELPNSSNGEFGLSSYMQIRQLKSDDSLLYKCLARNEFGSGERLIKLIVLGVPERPTELRVRDVWSRSALVSWRPPQQQQQTLAGATQPQQQPLNGAGATTTSAGRISNYTVQYWRKNPAGAPMQNQALAAAAAKQNHRREDLLVDGLHNSALLVNLLPAITYEVSVIAHNQVGQSEPSEPVNVTTSEEEPSAPPTDVQVEARGSATLRVMWKVPPAESLNGRLLGFYVGYRPRAFFGHPSGVGSSSNSLVLGHHQPGGSQQQQQAAVIQQQTGAGPSQQQLLQSIIYSFKTSDAIEGQLFYETFLTNLKHNQEYEITVRAFNKAGSGPDCHVITARTSSARLPQAPNLQVQRVTINSVTLKWTATVLVGANQAHSIHGRPSQTSSAQSMMGGGGMMSMGQPALEILRYVLYYQIQGERDWYELTVGRSPQEDQLQQQQQQLESSSGLMPADELVGGGGGGQSELITSQSSVHTLSNLQPGYTYRVYVAAANDYGIGDPSNVISLRTDSAAHNHTASAAFGAALLDDSHAGGGSLSSTGGLFDAWPANKQQGLLYTTLSFGALIVLLIMLTVYLIWQRKFRNKYNSSSASSYPSSWTPAASDTIQSEYSVKRFPNNPMIGSAGQAATHSTGGLGGAGELFGPVAAAAAAAADHATERRFASSTHRAVAAANQQQQQQQLLRNLGAGAGQSSTTSRPVPLSSHYHQPADLISNTSTLQLHSALHPSGQAAQFRHQKASATLNRNQNRQLPPIPYSTMSVKEMDNSKQWRLQQQDGNYRHCQQSLLRPNSKQQQQTSHHQHKQHQQQQQQMASSQTPLIYGVIE